MLRQLQLLPSGNYRLKGHSSGLDQAGAAAPYWALACSDGREIGRVIIPPSTSANGVFSGLLAVPEGCSVQTLTLVARPSDVITGLSGQIDHVALIPE